MDMRVTNSYTSTLDPQHPLHDMQNPTKTRRNIHLTPAQHYHTQHNTLPPVPDDSSLRTHIHTEFTQSALDSLPPWCPPPAACETELMLDRCQRVQLGRLRYGNSTLVPSYMHRLGRLLSQLWTGPNRHRARPTALPTHNNNTESHTSYIHWSTSGPAQLM